MGGAQDESQVRSPPRQLGTARAQRRAQARRRGARPRQNTNTNRRRDVRDVRRRFAPSRRSRRRRNRNRNRSRRDPTLGAADDARGARAAHARSPPRWFSRRAVEEGASLVPPSVHAWRVGQVIAVVFEGVTLLLAFGRNAAPWLGESGRPWSNPRWTIRRAVYYVAANGAPRCRRRARRVAARAARARPGRRGRSARFEPRKARDAVEARVARRFETRVEKNRPAGRRGVVVEEPRAATRGGAKYLAPTLNVAAGSVVAGRDVRDVRDVAHAARGGSRTAVHDETGLAAFLGARALAVRVATLASLRVRLRRVAHLIAERCSCPSSPPRRPRSRVTTWTCIVRFRTAR